MMEYKIANKIQGLLDHKGEVMNTILIHSENEKIIHISKEYDSSTGWHKRIISVGISNAEKPHEITRATFESRNKLKMLIDILQNHLEELE